MAEPRLDPTRALKPRFAEAILAEKKTVELRRVMPRITIPTLALLYATGPERSLVGTCIVHSVARLPSDELWRRHGTKTALFRPEFDAFLSGRDEGVALFLEQPDRLPAPIPLQALRRADNFRAPQEPRLRPPRATRAPRGSFAVVPNEARWHWPRILSLLGFGVPIGATRPYATHPALAAATTCRALICSAPSLRASCRAVWQTWSARRSEPDSRYTARTAAEASDARTSVKFGFGAPTILSIRLRRIASTAVADSNRGMLMRVSRYHSSSACDVTSK